MLNTIDRSRQRGAYAVWTTLFILAFVIAIVLNVTAVVMDSAD
jgi:hypothetical protein